MAFDFNSGQAVSGPSDQSGSGFSFQNGQIVTPSSMGGPSSSGSAPDYQGAFKDFISNPTSPLGYVGAVKAGFQGIMNAPSTITSQAESGFEQAKQGVSEIMGGEEPLKGLESGLRVESGLASAITSLLAPIPKPIQDAKGAIADKISDIPAVQKFAQTPAGETTSRISEDIANFGNIAGSIAGVGKGSEIAPGAAKDSFGAIRDVVSQMPEQVKTNMQDAAQTLLQNEVAKFIDGTKARQRATSKFENQGTPIREMVAAPSIFSGLKVENTRLNPSEAINTVEERIDRGMNVTKELHPHMDAYTPAVTKDELRSSTYKEADKMNLSPADTADLKGRIDRQINVLPDEMKPSFVDNLRAKMRNSSRDAQGIQKSTSEYTALENATRGLVFDRAEKLPEIESGEFSGLRNYIKQNIDLKEYLENIKGDVVSGGRLTGLFGKTIGAIAGAPFGWVHSILGSLAGGHVTDILSNNSLGSSLKMKLVRDITDNPEILKRAEQMLSNQREYKPLELPSGRGERGSRVTAKTIPGQKNIGILPSEIERRESAAREAGKIRQPQRSRPELPALNAPGQNPIRLP